LATVVGCSGERNDMSFVGGYGKHISFLEIAGLVIN
jgi:hypothetical protein